MAGQDSWLNEDGDRAATQQIEPPIAPSTARLEQNFALADRDIREGRFQRWLALIAGASSALSGLEVTYEHYRGGYSRRVMYTPVVLSSALAARASGVATFVSPRVAKTLLPLASVMTLADCGIGFYYHVRGIARKPGGWRLPITNMVIGPPVFAPLLFGTSAYLGLVASFLRRSDSPGSGALPLPTHTAHWAHAFVRGHEPIDWRQDLREGRFGGQMALAAAISAALSGFEAWYSHYKSNFRYGVQWTPVIIAPLLSVTALVATRSVRVAHAGLPIVSALAVANGSIGFAYHVRGVLRRPGGARKLVYNIIYGPPIFAPLLFAASGFFGLLASLLRRRRQ